MIESKYNLCLQDNTGMIIYNAKADEIVALNPHLAELYNQYRKKPEELSNHHSELFQMLVAKGFLDVRKVLIKSKLTISCAIGLSIF